MATSNISITASEAEKIYNVISYPSMFPFNGALRELMQYALSNIEEYKRGIFMQYINNDNCKDCIDSIPGDCVINIVKGVINELTSDARINYYLTYGVYPSAANTVLVHNKLEIAFPTVDWKMVKDENIRVVSELFEKSYGWLYDRLSEYDYNNVTTILSSNGITLIGGDLRSELISPTNLISIVLGGRICKLEDQAITIRNAIRNLPKDCCNVLWYFYILNYNKEAIAEKLSITVDKVDELHTKGIKLLKKPQMRFYIGHGHKFNPTDLRIHTSVELLELPEYDKLFEDSGSDFKTIRGILSMERGRVVDKLGETVANRVYYKLRKLGFHV